MHIYNLYRYNKQDIKLWVDAVFAILSQQNESGTAGHEPGDGLEKNLYFSIFRTYLSVNFYRHRQNLVIKCVQRCIQQRIL